MYHIVFRGINKQSIFEEQADYVKLKSILIELKEEMKYEIYVYCFMSNHVHLFLKEEKKGQISQIMAKDIFRAWLGDNKNHYALKDKSYKKVFQNKNCREYKGAVNTELATYGDAVLKLALCKILFKGSERLWIIIL